MIETWDRLLPFLIDVPFGSVSERGFHFGFENPAYSWGDASVLHAMIRLYRPARFIEIGSGWSSACTVDTVLHYLTGCDLTLIEPHAELLRNLLSDRAENIRVIESKVQDVPVEIFKNLQAGDILFIDSTHVLRTGSDVSFELFEILPNLAPGVLVHFHDMFWPFEYPREWVLDENRSWNELYAVRAVLTNNDQWSVLFFNNYFARFERPRIEETFPTFLRNSGGALWIVRES
ncbi:MAG: class I SAM-dependent methyltransferase [Bryobacteraceae bacterium]